MKILTSILLFLAGCGAIVYAYIASVAATLGDIEQTARSQGEFSAFEKSVNLILRGELPEPTALLYFGLLLIAVSVVNLFARGKAHDRRDPV
ncbi:MAG: hypothetical protein RIC52_13910 [Amphiplicatus sp.]